MRITHSWTKDTATIHVEGLTRPIRMIHITDSHVALVDERDADHVEACQRTCELFRTIRKADDGTPIPTDVTFEELTREARDLNPDILVLTGDIIHFPSQACLDHVLRSIDGLDIPVLYTAGNHDWHFPGVEGREELREGCRPLLEPLHRGNAAYGRYETAPMQWLWVDNSTYQITEEQLAFVTQNLANLAPTVLMMHIPLSLATLRDDTIERWNAPILIADPDWDLESRDRWGTGDDLQTTKAFARMLASAENLVAVFCGHVHFTHADTISPTAVQYVGASGFDAARRVVDFQPM